MNYFNIKRYKFSTVTKSLNRLLVRLLDRVLNFTKFINRLLVRLLVRLLNGVLNFIKSINLKKINNYFEDIKLALKKTAKYLYSRKDNIINIIKEIKFRSNKFLYYHLPAAIIFFGLLYLAIPIFYTYDKPTIQKAICKSENVECIIKGKVTYNFFPTPRLKIKDLTINIHSNKKITLLTANDASLKLSIKNLLAKDKHKIKKIILSDFEVNINLKRLKNYYAIFKHRISSIPIFFTKGKILLYEEKNYVATISDVNLIAKFLKGYSEAKLKGKFLNHDLIINFTNKTKDNKPMINLDFNMKDLNFYTKVSFFNLNKNINNGKFLIKKDKNRISGIFDYKDNQITILKSNIRNSFIDGKLIGRIIFLPYFDFNLDFNLNNINFTRLHNYFLSLDK